MWNDVEGLEFFLRIVLLFALRTEGNFNRHHLEWAEVKTLYLALILRYFCPQDGGSMFLSNLYTPTRLHSVIL
jgi:hypothetical protein